MKPEFHGRLQRGWKAWKLLAHKIGTFQARVLLTVIYAVVVLPFGICARLFLDPLRIKKVPTEWLPAEDADVSMESARKQ